MNRDTINMLILLKKHLDDLKASDKIIAEDIVDEVIISMVNEYENNYINYTPEEDSKTIDIYSYYERIDGLEERFLMLINGDKYTELPEETCARSFNLLKEIANAEGVSVRRMTKKELLEIGGTDAIGGYKFSINRKDFEKVIYHPQVLKKAKTISKTLSLLNKKN